MDGRLLDGVAVERRESGIPARQRYHFAAGQVDHLASVGEERGQVGGQNCAAIGIASDYYAARVSKSEGDDTVRFARAERDDGVGAPNLSRRKPSRLFQCELPVEIPLDQVRNALGIGLG